MKLLLYLLITAWVVVSNEAKLSSKQLSEIDSAIETLVIPSNRIPGFGIGIVEDGQVSYVKGYGHTNVTAGLPVQQNSLFGIGSTSKGITATMIVKVLHEKFPEMGESVLDVPISDLIPSFNFTLSDRMRTEAVSFRDLLSHRACLHSNDIHSVMGNQEDRQTLVYRLRYLPAACKFRSGFEYNNALITLAGELAAFLSNMTYEELISDFFQQVNMTDSTYFDKEGEFLSLPNLALPYVKIGDKVLEYNPHLLRTAADGNAAGGILSSPRDMAKYMALHLNKGKVGDVQVIPADVIGWVVKNNIQMDPSFKTKPNTELYYSNYGYALAYWVAVLDGYQMINHGGYYPPYNSQITWLPSLKVGVFTTSSGPGALFSEYNHMFIHFALAQMVFANLEERSGELNVSKALELSRLHDMDSRLSLPDTHFKTRVPSSVQPRPEPAKQARGIEDLLGVYGNPYAGDVLVRYDNGTGVVVFEYGVWGLAQLQPLSGDLEEFRLKYLTDIEMRAYADTWGGSVPDSRVLFRDDYLEFSSFMGTYRFHKNATLDTYPEVPFDPSTCVP